MKALELLKQLDTLFQKGLIDDTTSIGYLPCDCFIGEMQEINCTMLVLNDGVNNILLTNQ